MKVNGVLKLLEKDDVKLYEICEIYVPLKDVVNYMIRDAEEVILKKRILPFESLFNFDNDSNSIMKFRINIDNKIREIKGVIFSPSLFKTISFLSEYYVDGIKDIDNLIKVSGSKEKGIERALKTKPLNFIIHTEEVEKIEESFINYRGYMFFCSSPDESGVISIYVEKYLKFQNYRIPRIEFLLFPCSSPEKRNFIYYMAKRMNIRVRSRTNDFLTYKWINCIYYDGRRFQILRNIPLNIIEKFDKDGKLEGKLKIEEFLGYNFLNFKCFIPFKKKIKNKINYKRIKNPFNSNVIFAFDSRIPINFKKIDVIDNDDVIYAFKYIKEKNKVLENFPLIYFHPSVKENTEFLLIATL